MTTSPRNLFLPVLALIIALADPSEALVSFGYLSQEQAKEAGLEVRYRAAGPKDVRVEVSFPTTAKWESFRDPKPINYIELTLSNEAGKQGLRTALREQRDTKGRVSVNFTIERALLSRVEIWITRRIVDVADVVQMKDYIPLGSIDRDLKVVPSTQE